MFTTKVYHNIVLYYSLFIQKSVICEATSPPLSSPLSQGASATQSFGGSTCRLLAELAAESADCPYTQHSQTSLITASGFIPTDGDDEEERQDGERDKKEDEDEVDEQRTDVSLLWFIVYVKLSEKNYDFIWHAQILVIRLVDSWHSLYISQNHSELDWRVR